MQKGERGRAQIRLEGTGVSPILLHFVVGFAIPRIFRPIRSHTTKLIAVLGKEPYSIQRSSGVKNKMFGGNDTVPASRKLKF